MLPWAGYIRVSVVGGREGDSFRSPSDQRDAIERKAAEVGGGIVVLEPDLDAKGDDPERDTLTLAIEGVERGVYCGLIVPYLSRLSRRTRDTLEMWDRVKGAGGRILVVEGDLDSDRETPELRFQLTVLSAMDEMEHRRATDRFDRQRRSAVDRGIWMPRQVPRGYVKDPATRRLVLAPDWEFVREKAFRARAARRPATDIAVDLGMTYTGVKHLLGNRVYLGELRHGGFVNTKAHPPLVTEDEWLAAQVDAPRKRRREGSPSLLSGLVRCAGCGHAMSAGTYGSKAHYSCAGISGGGKCPARAAISMKILDAYVEPIALAEFARLSVRSAEDPERIAGLRTRVREASEELAAYVAAVSAADIGAKAFGEGARTRRGVLRDAEEELSQALSAAVVAPAADLLRLWPQMPQEMRTRALAGLIEAVVVKSSGRRHVPVADRVRVVRVGAGVASRHLGGSRSLGIHPIDFGSLDHKAVLGV